MTLEEMKKTVSLIDYIRGTGKTITHKGGDIFRVDPCPVCGHKDHFTIYKNTNSYFSFSNCTDPGSIIDYFINVENLKESEAIRKLEELAGQRTERKPEYKKNLQSVSQADNQSDKEADYTELTNILYQKMTPQGKEYLLNRGIPEHLISEYKLSVGTSKYWKGERAFFPTWKNGKVTGYTTRAIKEGQEPKYQEATGSKAIFNEYLIEQAQPGEVIPIFEGVIDAILFEYATGIKAVATKGGVPDSLKKAIEKAPEGVTYLTGFDNDEAGQNYREKTGFTPIEIPDSFKDMADYVMNDEVNDFQNVTEAFTRAQRRAEGLTEDISYYIGEAFLNELEENRNTPRIETKLKALDTTLNGGLYPGLHIIGGEPGIGKTAFCMQLADTIAEQERPVLYISLEMSKYELVCRSLSRIAYTAESDRSTTTGKILNGEVNQEHIRRLLEGYKKTVKNNLTIIQGDFKLTLEDIRKEASIVKKLRGKAPVIIVDYLQILQGNDPKKDIRMVIDENMVFLKRISRDLNTPVIAISSLSRSGQATISMSSFKESGGIEYSADSLMALSFNMNEMRAAGETEEGRREAREQFLLDNGYYPVILSVLKNRRGLKGTGINLEWEPGHNYFHAPIRGITPRNRL